MNFIKKPSKNSEAIMEMLLSCFLISLMVGIIRHLSRDFHVFFIIAMRNLFALFCFLPQLIQSSKELLQTKNLKMHLFRGANGAVSMVMWFYAISALPLSESVALTFTVPIITTFAASIFFGEKISKKVYISCFIAFIGVLIILRPGFRSYNVAHLAVLGAVITWTLTNLLVKQMTKTEKPTTIVAYMSFFIFIFSAPFALPYIKAVNLANFLWLFLVGALSVIAQILIASAFKKAPISILQPFDFSRLIFTSIIAYFIFGEKPDFFVFLGALVILAAMIYALPRRDKTSTLLP